ncbi:MAG: DUF4286 family protein [Muribaculaceae bacterium]|nr:hypothetical protein [Bacteroides sp.]MDE6071253.1 DUF4286 family protein [Muribaculaceae bacterium]
MLIHNATFMVEPQRGAEFLEWFAPLAHKAGPEGKSRLSVMRQAGGAVAGEAQALSVAFQGEFDTMEEIELWTSKRLNPLVAAFQRRFAPDAMVFTSIFETIF